MTASVSRPASDGLPPPRAGPGRSASKPSRSRGDARMSRREPPWPRYPGRRPYPRCRMAATPTSEGRRTAWRAAQEPARRAGRLPVPRRARARSSTSARRSRSASASPATSPTRSPAAPSRWSTRSSRIEFLLVATRGRGAAGRAELHQAVPAALQHPAARRQVVSVHRDLDGRGVPARLLHARAPPPRPRSTSARTRTPSACAARSTCSARSSCSAPAQGAEPGPAQRLAVPGLLHQALRGALRRLRRSQEEYRESIDGVIAFLSGPLPRDRARPRAAHEARRPPAQEFEQAALERNRLRAVRSLLERQRVANESVGTLDAVAVARRRHGRQRAGLPGPRRRAVATASPSTSPTRASATLGEVARGVPPAVLRRRDVDPAADHRPGRASRTSTRSAEAAAPSAAARRVEVRARRARRQAPHPRARRAQRAARARPGAPEGRAPPPAARRGARRAAGGARARRAAAADRVLRHLEPHGHAHGRVDGRLRGRRAEEVRLPALQRPRARRRACPTTSRRWRRCSARRLRAVGAPAGPLARTTPSATSRSRRCRTSSSSTAARASSPRACARSGLPRARRRGRLAGQAASRRSSCPGRRDAARARRTTRPRCSCCSACATRRTASRSPTTARAATRR